MGLRVNFDRERVGRLVQEAAVVLNDFLQVLHVFLVFLKGLE